MVVFAAGSAWALPAQSDGALTLAGSGPVVAAAAFSYLNGEYPTAQRQLLAWNLLPSPTSPPRPVNAVQPTAPVHVATPPRAAPSIVIGSTQQVLINKDRAGAGLRPLSWSSCLYSVALSNARRMVAQGFISHTNGPTADLGCRLGISAGENVGYWTGGVDDMQLNTMFMSSPDHRANIMGPFHYVAAAWVIASNGVAYIAVEFG